MNLKTLIISTSLLGFITACGDDVSSNRKMGKPTQDTQAVENGTKNQITSFIHRERGATVLSSLEEASRIISNNLPVTYRTIPLMEKDDEGSRSNVLTRSDLGRPTVTCGLGTAFSGIDSRIADCFQKNTDKALWQGQLYGSSGEGDWKLVSRTEDGAELWLDNRTGLVWSDVVKTADKSSFNWCMASGNDDLPSSVATVDCNDLMDQTRVCQDLVIEGLAQNVKWRLPTRNDFLQADINGARFVLKSENSSGLWTATMRAKATGRTEAWVYHSSEGTLSGAPLSSERQVRCIGAAIR